MKRHGEAASANVKTVKAERARIQKIIQDGGSHHATFTIWT